MAVNSELIETIKASKLPKLANPTTGDLIHAQGDDLSTTSLSFFLDKINSGIYGTLKINTVVPTTGYQRYDVKEANTYTNVTPNITVTQNELDENFVFITITNGTADKLLSKKPNSKTETWEAKAYKKGSQVFGINGIYEAKNDTVPEDIPGVKVEGVTTNWAKKISGLDMALLLDPNNSTLAQSGKSINEWLSYTVEGGEADGNGNPVVVFDRKTGANLDGTSDTGIDPGTGPNVYFTNENCKIIKETFIKKGGLRFSVGGAFRVAIGTITSNGFNERWVSDEFTGTVAWIEFDIAQQAYAGEWIVIKSIQGSTGRVFYANNGSDTRFTQISTSGNITYGGQGSYYSLWFDLYKTVDGGQYSLKKSIATSVNSLIDTGYIGKKKAIGEINQLSLSDKTTEGYVINKIILDRDYKIDEIKMYVATNGLHNFVIGKPDQYGKFIERARFSINLFAGISIIPINGIIYKGEMFGLRTPIKYYYNDPSGTDLLISDSYTGILQEHKGLSLGLEMKLSEIISLNVVSKGDLTDINSEIYSLNSRLTNNGQRVRLLFNPNGSVSWQNIGYSKISHLGNSLAFHPVMGYWWGSWGMAASEKSKDYVHQFLSLAIAQNPAATTDVFNIAEWESQQASYDFTKLDQYIVGKDLIVLRVGENASYSSNYQANFNQLVEYIISKNSTARIVIGGMFWTDASKDAAMRNVATAHGLTFVELSDLNIPENKSSMGAQVKGDDGQWHTVDNGGVADHPGDLGMQRIATRLFNAL